MQSSNELLTSLLAQQQQQLLLQQQSEINEDTPLQTISETVTIETIKPTPVITQKTKNIRKTVPIQSTFDDKKLRIDPEDGIRYDLIIFLLFSNR